MERMDSFRVSDVNLDTREMIMHFDNGRKGQVQKIPYDQIHKLVIMEDVVTKWFRKKRVGMVEVHVKNKEYPFLIQEDRIRAPFDATVEYLRKNASKYEIDVDEK